MKRKHISCAIWTSTESAVLLEEKNFSWKANLKSSCNWRLEQKLRKQGVHVLEILNEKALKALLKTTIFLPVKKLKPKHLHTKESYLTKNNSLPVMLLMLLSVHQFLFLLFLQQVDISPFNKSCTSGFGQNKCIYNKNVTKIKHYSTMT